jgi:hypothetical protein
MSASACAHASAHLLAPTLLLLASVVLVGMTASDGIQSGLDLVSVFAYSKAPVDRAAALRNNTQHAQGVLWHGDASDAAHCLDMSYFSYPSVRFVAGADPTTPTCQITFALALAGLDVSVAPVADYSALSCRLGIYPLQIIGGSAGVSSLNLNIQANGTRTILSVPGVIAGAAAGFANREAWAACRDRRRELAQQFLGNTSCQGEYSPLCTCVRAFTDKLTNLNQRLRARAPDGQSLEDVLRQGVEQCIALRRPHDVRREAGPRYARSKALLVFALALFFNAALLSFGDLPAGSTYTVWVHIAWHALLFGSVLLAGLLTGGQAEYQTVLSILLPAFLVHGAYYLLAESLAVHGGPTPRPYLHPVVFDLCLCSLALFTLVERGVVQSELLIAEIFKCHGVALLYIAAIWYHRHMAVADGASRALFSSSPVHQAHVVLSVVALAASADSLLVPYAAKMPFELHWLMPLAFTFLALSNPGWVYAYNAQRKYHPDDPATRVYGPAHFNCLAAALVAGFGLALWGYFLREYIRVYGAAHFPYGTLDDLRLPLFLARSV